MRPGRPGLLEMVLGRRILSPRWQRRPLAQAAASARNSGGRKQPAPRPSIRAVEGFSKECSKTETSCCGK
jgi:hypothetical protein